MEVGLLQSQSMMNIFTEETARDREMSKRRNDINQIAFTRKRSKFLMEINDDEYLDSSPGPAAKVNNRLGLGEFRNLHAKEVRNSGGNHEKDLATRLDDTCSSPALTTEDANQNRTLVPTRYLIKYPSSSESSNSGLERDPAGRTLLASEIKLLCLLRHDHIVRLHQVTSDPEWEPYVVIDKVTHTLQDKLASWSQTCQNDMRVGLRVMCSLARALNFMHDKRTMFRGLEPANVGFNAAGNLKLFTFALAKELPAKDESAYMLTAMIGSRNYISPENYLGEPYGLPTDVYSFCVLAWEVLSLNRAFSTIFDERDYVAQVVKGRHRPEVPRRWPILIQNILRYGWATNPTMRPTMKIIDAALGEYVFGHPADSSCSDYINVMLLSSGTFINM
jgi:serine/threonine protein kinase